MTDQADSTIASPPPKKRVDNYHRHRRRRRYARIEELLHSDARLEEVVDSTDSATTASPSTATTIAPTTTAAYLLDVLNEDPRNPTQTGDLDPVPEEEEEGEGTAEEHEEKEPFLEMYPTIPCPCPCHENNEQREGRPWLGFGNAAYLVCPMCWVDAYMRAHGDKKRGWDCHAYLSDRGKDPLVPASKQC
ncbi:hypothetical protein F4821DRAFT_255442 [Hypoxylon rubiginosum]|uniref:Uncharacterized protein n=1 Tax=Hypoxylon rubiginosum TaxID=110542 RepID=A0ACC0DEC8_9PEZI|nr:hypothetical protein F4821DRAFT_255442 [Hypoxylon rubiginosum]